MTPSCSPWSAGAGRRTTSRCGSSARTRGSGWPAAHEMPDLCLQMLLRGRNTVGYTPYPTEVTSAFVHEAADTGIDIFRIFDALNDVDQMRPAIEAVRETGSTVAEVALCYTADLLAEEDLYTLDYYLSWPRRSSAPARTSGDQGHGRAAAAAGGDSRWSRRCGNASTCRSTCTPTTPRAASSRPCWPRSTPGWTRSTSRRRDVRDDQPAADVGAGGRAGAHRARHRPGPARGHGPRALLGAGAQAVRAVRVRAAVADRPGLRPRDPRRAALQPAAAGHRARAGGEVRADRGDVRRGGPDPRPADQGDAVVQGRRRPGAAPGRRRADPEEFAATRSTSTSRTRWSGSWPASSATRRAAGRSRSGPRRCRADGPGARRRAVRGDRPPGRGTRPAGDAEPAAVPRPDQGAGHPGAVRRRRSARHPGLPVRDAAGRGARRPSARASA